MSSLPEQTTLSGVVGDTTPIQPLPQATSRQAAALGLELTPVSLQQLLIHLTSTASHRKAREGV